MRRDPLAALYPRPSDDKRTTRTMSIVSLAWVLKHSEATLGQRLVLIVLAEHSHDDGTAAWPSIATLAERTRLSERQVQYALRALEKDGRIEKTGVSKKGTNIYRLIMDEGVQILHPGGAESSTEGVQSVAPEPSIEPPLKATPPVVPPSNEVEKPEVSWPKTVDRRPVAAFEGEQAVAILGVWNTGTGQRLRSKDALGKIIMRLREWPDGTVRDHRLVIEDALDHPWWDGPPSLSVVYGSEGQFERCVEAARQRGQPTDAANMKPGRYGRGLTTRQILDMTSNRGGTESGDRAGGARGRLPERGVPEGRAGGGVGDDLDRGGGDAVVVRSSDDGGSLDRPGRPPVPDSARVP